MQKETQKQKNLKWKYYTEENNTRMEIKLITVTSRVFVIYSTD
jgi:hypothetical protein